MSDPRSLGRVRHVIGATVTVELDPALAGVSPIVAGRVHRVGQVGSLVRIPQGPVSLIALVSLVGISELAQPLAPVQNTVSGDRWLQVVLVGEVDSLGKFERGVSTYPALDDEVWLLMPEEVSAILPPAATGRVRLGRLSTAEAPVSIDVAALVARHGAVVGSTGSGKSFAVSHLLQQIASEWPAANVVVVDPHGEYERALGEHAVVRKVLSDDPTSRLRVPYWALPAQDLLMLVAGRVEGVNTLPRFMELVTEARRSFAAKAAWVDTPEAAIAADTPIPFDLRNVWYQMDRESHAVYTAKTDPNTEVLATEGDAAELIPSTHGPYGMGSAAPYKGERWAAYGTTPQRMRLRLKDPSLEFLLAPLEATTLDADPLPAVIAEWLGAERAVSVLDFSGVPADVSDIAVGLVMRLIFELATRAADGDDVGRSKPVLFVLEEAHRYLGDASTVRVAKDSANRISREGRKYGVGLLLVTQRPSELPDTALSQVGTIVALRLSNTGDQSKVKSALPDALAGLVEALPSLRTGEAIVSGEAVRLPVRVILDRPIPEPGGSDPTLEGWTGAPRDTRVLGAINRWRQDLGG